MEYTAYSPDGIPAWLRDKTRQWFIEECPLPWLEVVPDRYALYASESDRALAEELLPRKKLRTLLTTACVCVMEEQIILATAKDEETDPGLEVFARWLAGVWPHQLTDSGIPIQPEDLTDPELYE